MLKYFIKPNGDLIEVEEALRTGALSDRYPCAYLNICAEERIWTGIPSTTQLINGTRMEYLKILTNYAVDPDQCAFRVAGTGMHQTLKKYTPNNSIAEMAIPDDEITGIPDLIEEQPNGETWLVDYKDWGAYRVKRFFEGDTFDVDMQLNRYKLVVEEYFGIKIHRMKVFAKLRDGGLEVARRYKLDQLTYYLDIKKRDVAEVEIYFQQKRQALLNSLTMHENDGQDTPGAHYDEILAMCSPPMCNEQENWKGVRCKRFCPVWKACMVIGNHYLGDTNAET
jgi:hypothetical protein